MKNLFKKWIGSKVVTKSVSFIKANFNGGLEDLYDSLNLNTYKDSLYLFIGVSMIRETVSSIPLEMYRIKNSDGDTEQVFDDVYLDLLERPNYRQTQKEFWKLAVAYYLLAGETFWYLDREGGKGFPKQMVNLRPDSVEVLFSQDRTEIVAYKFYKTNGESIVIAPDDILHIKNIDPTNVSRGVGIIRPATQRIITEKEASKYQAQTFKNQGRPDIAVFVDQELDNEEAEEARGRWNKIYGSEDRSAAGFFGNQVRDIKLLNASPKEMDFINSQNFLRDDILAALRIPKAMITSDDVNLANSKTARINYVKEACLPVLDAFIDIINNKLLNDMGEDKFITYDSPVNEDRDSLRQEAKELYEVGLITQNEGREIVNFPSIDEGDSFKAPGGLFQLSVKKIALKKQALRVLRKRKITYRKLKAVEALAELNKQTKGFGVQRERNSVFNTPELKEKYIKTFNEGIDKKADVFKDTIDVYNDGFYKRIMKQLEDFGINPSSFFDVATEMQEARKAFLPLMKNLYLKAGQDTLDAVSRGFSNKAAEQFYSTDDVIRELELRAEFFITSMLDTDYKEMKEIIAQGLKDGLSVNQIGQSLRLYFDDMSVARAKTIARTETGRLISKATNEAYAQSEVVTGKQWLTSRDGNVRDKTGTVNDHTINDGKIVGVDERFPNGEMYPGELTINCRCAIAPAV